MYKESSIFYMDLFLYKNALLGLREFERELVRFFLCSILKSNLKIKPEKEKTG